MPATYVRRWPIEDQEMTKDELRGEAATDLIEALEYSGLRVVPESATFTIIPGTVPFFEARVKIHPGSSPAVGVPQVRNDAEFNAWHAAQYYRRHQEMPRKETP